MSEQEEFAGLTATFKFGEGGFQDPWLVVRANDQDDLDEKLVALKEGDTLQHVSDVGHLVGDLHLVAVKPAKKAASRRDEEDDDEQEERPTKRQTRGSSNQSSSRGGSGGSSRQRDDETEEHPEGLECDKRGCGEVLVYKKIKSRKGTFEMWSCPNQREKGDGHLVEWI